ncbi:MAG: glycosyltransferase family 2 protein [Acidobacteria bacterium]|nr:glycosyltransferase family 2 protein [Acidobacteriota bacterium]
MSKVDLEKRRAEALRQYAIRQALERYEAENPNFTPEAVVASLCAYEEEGNIGQVLEKMPETINGHPYTTLVVVDGGSDRTAEIARSFPGVQVIEFPVNLGHGVALQVTYRYCIDRGVKYVITLDADGQNDPNEMGNLLEPLVEDRADFVLTSRVLGTDETGDMVRKVGVRFFSFIINRMVGARLTDTSTGYRGLRVSMLAEAVDRLVQSQYQTSELIIVCLRRGYRPAEVPTIWHPRASGTTKKGKNWLFGFRYAKVVFGTYWRERNAPRSASRSA